MRYCSGGDCQRRDWKKHRGSCRPPPASHREATREDWSLASGNAREYAAYHEFSGGVARELKALRAGKGDSLSRPARTHAAWLDARRVGVAADGRLEEASAVGALRALYGDLRRAKDEDSKRQSGKSLEEVISGSAARKKEVHDELLRLAIRVLLRLDTHGPRGKDAIQSVSAAPYASRGKSLLGARAAEALAALDAERFVVLDGAVDANLLDAVRRDVAAAAARGLLRSPEQQRAAGTRGDSYGWLHERDAGPALAHCVESLKGVAAHLDPGALEVDEKAMLTHYPPPEAAQEIPYRGYIPHQDNHRDAKTDACLNKRAYTAILYVNAPDWPDAKGGHLLLYPGTADATALDPDASRRARRVAPRGGRLVLFSSFLWHEVRPATQSRFALTTWINDPRLATMY